MAAEGVQPGASAAVEAGKSNDKAFPVHPLFFAAFPVLSLFSSNLAIVPLEDLWRPLGLSLLAAIAIWLILWPVFRSIRKAAIASSVFVTADFLYSTIAAKVSFLSQPIVWLVLTGVLAVVVAFRFRWTGAVNVLAVVLVLVATGNIVWSEARIAADESHIQRSVASGSATTGPAPDIFYIILDGYGRRDSLQRAIHFDDTSFLSALRDRGFYVADHSHSNYVQTEISLSSSLNLQFIPTLLPKMSRNSTDRKVFDSLISQNQLSTFLRDRGYRTIGITSGFPPVAFPYDDLWLSRGSDLSLFETTLLQMTPLVPSGGSVGSQFLWRHDTLLAAFQSLRDLATPASRPRFVFVHILAPHPPFVLKPDESYVRPRGPFGYWDGSDYMAFATPDSYRTGYAGQVQAINAEVLKSVDALTAAAKVKPIIVIQGDHGSKVGLDQNDLSKTDVTECFENLAAFYGPPSVIKSLYPGITPVNEFRVVLDSLFGARLPMLPDRSWYSPFAYPFEFTDVTSKVIGTGSALVERRHAPPVRSAIAGAAPAGAAGSR